MARFGRVLTAMITPFHDNGALDLDGASRLARWLVDHGSEGLVVAGTTGESPTLTHEEQAELVGAVASSVDVPVVAGAGSNDTRAAVDLTERVAAGWRIGRAACGWLLQSSRRRPVSTSISGLAPQSTDLPVILYDIPVRTGRKIAHRDYSDDSLTRCTTSLL